MHHLRDSLGHVLALSFAFATTACATAVRLVDASNLDSADASSSVDASTVDSTLADSGILAIDAADALDTGADVVLDTGVFLGQGLIDITAQSTRVRFERAADLDVGCTTAIDDTCRTKRCPLPRPSTSMDAGVPNVGTITLTAPLHMEMVVPASDGRYPDTSYVALYRVGDALGITAPGADIPGFTIMTVVPHDITITSPLGPSALDVSRSSPLDATWIGGAEGTTEVTLSGTSPGERITIVCDFAAVGGRGRIPAAATARVPNAIDRGTIGVRVFTRTGRSLDGWSIDTTVSGRVNTNLADVRFVP